MGRSEGIPQTVVEAIRKIDPDNVIILVTPSWDQDVDIAANDPLTGFQNIMYTLYYYAATHKQELRNKTIAAIDKGPCSHSQQKAN